MSFDHSFSSLFRCRTNGQSSWQTIQMDSTIGRSMETLHDLFGCAVFVVVDRLLFNQILFVSSTNTFIETKYYHSIT